jgi:predicted metal-binding protein
MCFMTGKQKQNFVIVCPDCQESLEAHSSFQSSSHISKHGFMDMTKEQSSNGGLDIGFIECFWIVTTSNYNAVTNLYTLLLTTAHTESSVSSLAVFW